MTYTLTTEQYGKLEGLAYRVADNAYMLERHGRESARHELADNHKTILMLFDELDRLGVPFWVQNSTICWAEDWRRYKSEYLYQGLERRGIHRQEAA